MNISIKNLIPKPLLDFPELNSEVWLKQMLEFSAEGKYMIYSQSGKGKTSLLSMLYGLRKDYEGEVLFDGENIQKIKQSKWVSLRKDKISMVFQGLELFDKLKVSENIMLKNRLTDFISESEILSMMETLDIKQLYQKRVGEISFGQKQRVAIIRALCQPFELLMLDEPFSHIDVENRSKAFQLVMNAVDKQKSILIISSLVNENNTGFIKYKI